ncbi:MAG: hypothetical protein ABI980_15025 [Nitrospirota bacterium]
MALRFSRWALGVELARKLIQILLPLLAKNQDATGQTDSRADRFEEALARLAARSAHLDRRIKQIMVVVIVSFFFSLGALIIVLAR